MYVSRNHDLGFFDLPPIVKSCTDKVFQIEIRHPVNTYFFLHVLVMNTSSELSPLTHHQMFRLFQQHPTK